MNRIVKIAIALAALIAITLAFDYWNVTRKEKLLSHAVSLVGGRNGSIPLWPIGTEYRIVLTAVPDAEQVDKLRIANQMRGWVGIAFEDCDLTYDDVDRMRKHLPECHLFVVRDGKMTAMENPNSNADDPSVAR